MRNDVVALAFEDPDTPVGKDPRERRRRLAHEREALPTGEDEGWSRNRGRKLARQRSVAQDLRFVYEGVRHSLERRPERGLAQLGDDIGGYANALRLEEGDRIAPLIGLYQPA